MKRHTIVKYPKPLNVRVNDAMYAALVKESKRTGNTVGELVRRAISKALGIKP